MPNILTSIFVSSPATEPVEAPHPNTGVYVTGTQAAAGGPWTVVHTLVSKTTTPLTIVGRLKNYPAVTVSVVASGGPNAGNIFNNILATPTGTAATATSSTALNVAVSSISNQTGYRLLAADAAAGPFTQIYQGTTASYPHTGLTASQTKYYQWQYVGGGYYDDSPVSAVFSGVTAAAAAIAFTPQTADYGLLAMSRADAGGNVQRSFGSTLDFTSNQSSLVLTLLNTEAAGNAQPSGITILQAGQAPQVVRPTGGAAASNYPLTLLGTAPFNGRIILGTLERANEVGDILGRVVQKLTFATGSTSSLIAPVKKSACVIYITDSIGTGTGTTTPETDGWLPQLRVIDSGRDHINNGYQSRQLRVALADAPSITLLNNELAAASAGYTTVTYALCLGTNDYSQTPSVLAGFVNNWLTAARTQFPAATLLVASPIIANSAYANETNLPNIRQALLGTVTGRTNVSYVDGLTLLNDNTRLTADNVHPNIYGHTIIANGWLQALTLGNGLSTTVDNSNIVYAPTVAAGGFKLFQNTTVVTENTLMAAQNYVGNVPANGPVLNCSISVPFNGTQIKIGYHRETQGSLVDVLIDGVLVGVIDQYTGGTPIPGYHFLTPPATTGAGNHTLTLKKSASGDQSKIFWLESLVVYGGTGVPATAATSTYQAETSAYLSRLATAGGNLTTAQKDAVDAFVNTLKTQSIYTRMQEFWPIAGGVAASHALGFKNAANLTWSGGITHSATGALGDGTSGYGNTNINPSTVGGVVGLNDTHISYYSRQNIGSTAGQREMGVADEATGASVLRIMTNIQNSTRMEVNSAGQPQTAVASTAGFFLASRQLSTSMIGYQNGAAIFTGTINTSSLPNGPLAIMAQASLTGTIAGYSTKECAFASIGGGLTAAQVSTLSTAVQTLQTALGRNV